MKRNRELSPRKRAAGVGRWGYRTGLIGLAACLIVLFLWVALQNDRESPRPDDGARSATSEPAAVTLADPDAEDPSLITRSGSRTGDPAGVASLNAPETAQRMIELADEYSSLEKSLYRQAPHLPDIASWLNYREREQFYFPNKELVDRVNSDLEFKKKTLPEQGQILTLHRPANLLELLDDPEFKTWTEEVYEIAGLKEAFPAWLEEWDGKAGYTGAKTPTRDVDTLAEFRTALEERVPFYTGAREEAESNSELPSWMFDYLNKFAIHSEKTRMAQYYHDSFFGGRFQEIESEYRALAERFAGFQISGSDSGLDEATKGALANPPSRRLQKLGGFQFYYKPIETATLAEPKNRN